MKAQRSYAGALIPVVVALVFVTAILLPLVRTAGVPAFLHDWLWPVSHTQCLAFSQIGMSPWRSSGVGAPQVYPEPWLPYLFSGVLCAAAGPQLALLFFLLAVFSIASIGISCLSERLGFGIGAKITALAVFLGNPVVLNKLHAGHVLFLFSYALTPLVAYLSLRNQLRAPALLLGVALGIGSAQQQFFVFGCALALVLSIADSKRWALRVALPGIAIGFLFISPQWVLGLLFAPPDAFGAVLPLSHWEVAQSATLSDAIRMLGYIGHYAEQWLPPAFLDALWMLPAAAAAGLVLHIRDRIAIAFGVVTAAAIVFSWGLLGPLHTPLAWAFSRISASAMFRELYDVAGLTALGFAVLSGLLVKSMQQRRLASGIVTTAIVLLCFCVAQKSSYGIPSYSPSLGLSNLISVIAAAPGNQRYAPVPGIFPQSLSGAQETGLSPFLLPLGHHASIADSLATYPNTYASEANGLTRSRVMRMLGVSFTLQTAGIVRRVNVEPSLAGIVPAPLRTSAPSALIRQPAQTMLIEPYATRIGSLENEVSDANFGPTTGGSSLNLLQAVTSPDPRQSWAAVVYWPNLPAWAFAVPSRIFTMSPRAPILPIGPALIVAGNADGRIRSRDCSLLQKIDLHFSAFTCREHPLFVGRPPMLIATAVMHATLVHERVTGSNGALEEQAGFLPFLRKAHIRARAGSVLILRERYDRLWRCLDVPAVHVLMDGYANGWVLEHDEDRDVTVVYFGALPYYIAMLISFILLLSALFSLCRGGFAK